MITKEQKSQIIAEYGRGEGDTGSPEVQVAILTARINDLTDHFKANPKDQDVYKRQNRSWYHWRTTVIH